MLCLCLITFFLHQSYDDPVLAVAPGKLENSLPSLQKELLASTIYPFLIITLSPLFRLALSSSLSFLLTSLSFGVKSGEMNTLDKFSSLLFLRLLALDNTSFLITALSAVTLIRCYLLIVLKMARIRINTRNYTKEKPYLINSYFLFKIGRKKVNRVSKIRVCM